MPSNETSAPTPFQAGTDAFLATLHITVPRGVLVEIDYFLPDGWRSAIVDDWHHVIGPGGPGWPSTVRRLAAMLAYAEGNLLRRVSDHRWELYTWRDADGAGFRVAFLTEGDPRPARRRRR
jgi:hypothetical protein